MGLGLQIELEEIEGRLILRIEGRIDVSSSPILERKIAKLIEEGQNILLLDFSRVEYLSSAGIRVLLAAQKKLKEKKKQMLLFSLEEEVYEVIAMAGFDKIFKIFRTEKEALQYQT